MSSAPAPEEIWRDAHWLAQALDPRAGLVRLVEMAPEDYRQASFLDDRMLQQPRNANLLKWPDVLTSMPADARNDACWIFHIGHVGSTLIARLLGELDGVLSVREPRFLRDLTAIPAEQRSVYCRPTQSLMSRAFADNETALVKATSFVSEIAPELVPLGGRVLFMFATPQAYIESILAGENSRKEMAILADARAQRMVQRVSGLAHSHRSEAHLAAAAWACEMTALEASAEAMADRHIEWADFDRMLEDMEAALGRSASFFGLNASSEQITAALQGPLMSRYSKALEYEYSPTLRRELLTLARRERGASIDSALAMLERAAENAPLLTKALNRAQRES